MRNGYQPKWSDQIMGEALEVSTYIPERKRAGKRNWDGKQSEQQAVESNQSRVTGDYGKQLLRRRGELVERSFAHCCETGGMRRSALRGHENILKRLLRRYQRRQASVYRDESISAYPKSTTKSRQWYDH
jgi:hypothetical protein